MNAVTPRLGALVVDGVTLARRGREDDLLVARDAEAEDVDERIPCVAAFEQNLAADRCDADGRSDGGGR